MSFERIIIPARAGSKGWPRKNTHLFDHTAKTIPVEYAKRVLVTTDDDHITALSSSYNFQVHDRPEKLSQDGSDIRSVVKDAMKLHKYKSTDIIIMLYLTYPDRSWDQVQAMYNNFVSSGSKSMLCRQPVLTHPCLTMFDTGSGTGKQIIKHEHYQRQQYPECFEISHYICMFRYGELKNLNKNMYNDDTHYNNIDRTVDVDSETDYKKFILNNEH